ncbi:MAG: ABC transporter six-transmembrane domain-containing protein [Pseudomonadota bacterium]
MGIAERKLSLGSLIGAYRMQVGVTWALTLLETVLLAGLPLQIGCAIDGLLSRDFTPFYLMIGLMAAALALAVARRVYDARAFASMRVDIGDALVRRTKASPVSTVNARLDMTGEIVDFLEHEAPAVMASCVQALVAVAVLWSFDAVLTLAAGGATLAVLLIYAVASGRFFNLNRTLNKQVERQVATLHGGHARTIRAHLTAIRDHRVAISDAEALTYGLILAVLMSMLIFNLQHATLQLDASPGRVFSIVTYSYEFLEAAVVLPAALQSLTRIAEITQRINGSAEAHTGERPAHPGGCDDAPSAGTCR